MNFFVNIIGYFISVPARLKGMEFGRNSFIAPGYDFLFEQLKNIRIGDNCKIGKNAWLHTVNSGIIQIDDNTNIGRNATIGAIKKIEIGKNVLFSFGATVLDHDHEFQDKNLAPINSGLTEGEAIVIDDDCFIGAHSFVLKGVHLGKHCVVGANSVVTKSFPAYSVVAGSPAKIIRTIKQ